MESTILNQEFIDYPEELFKKWREEKDFSIIPSIIPNANRNRIEEKAGERSNRYFKEMFVLKKKERELTYGLYSHSFPWLYAENWRVENPKLKTAVHQEFYDLLIKYCGKDKVKDLQKRIESYIDNKPREFWPKEPDLLIIDKKRNAGFIEVKGFGESINYRQLAGIAFIKKYMNCSASIIRLYEDNVSPEAKQKKRKIEKVRERFLKIYNSLPD